MRGIIGAQAKVRNSSCGARKTMDCRVSLSAEELIWLERTTARVEGVGGGNSSLYTPVRKDIRSKISLCAWSKRRSGCEVDLSTTQVRNWRSLCAKT